MLVGLTTVGAMSAVRADEPIVPTQAYVSSAADQAVITPVRWGYGYYGPRGYYYGARPYVYRPYYSAPYVYPYAYPYTYTYPYSYYYGPGYTVARPFGYYGGGVSIGVY
jgi:hypothetical protein